MILFYVARDIAASALLLLGHPSNSPFSYRTEYALSVETRFIASPDCIARSRRDESRLYRKIAICSLASTLTQENAVVATLHTKQQQPHSINSNYGFQH